MDPLVFISDEGRVLPAKSFGNTVIKNMFYILLDIKQKSENIRIRKLNTAY